MNMISIVNEAINRKLNSMSFTDIVAGRVESVNPLQIRINDRIVIGQSFIEPNSLGLNDYSPNSVLPLVVGNMVQMIRYNNGQRFYVIGIFNIDTVYPVGTTYETVIDMNPCEKFGGNWECIGQVDVNGTTIHKWVRLPDATNKIILETGFDLLLENGRRLLLENECGEQED